METLPLELHAEIFAYLLSSKAPKDIIAVPVSTISERTDVYNLRLTSRRLLAAALPSFVRILEDVPTATTEESIEKLVALHQLSDVSSSLTCLTLSACKVSVTVSGALTETKIIDSLRASWWEKVSRGLISVISQATKLQHVICIVGGVCVTRIEPGTSMGRFAPRDSNFTITNAMDVIAYSLESTERNQTLKTISLLAAQSKTLKAPYLPPAHLLYLPYLSLKHLTVAPAALNDPVCRLQAPHLTSLHIILSNAIYDSHERVFPALLSASEGHSKLCKITISGGNEHIDVDILMDYITRVLNMSRTLLVLIVRDMKVVTDIGYDVPTFHSNGRVGSLIFDNFTYCLVDEITLTGPSEPKELSSRWKPLAALRLRANAIHMMQNGRLIQEELLEETSRI